MTAFGSNPGLFLSRKVTVLGIRAARQVHRHNSPYADCRYWQVADIAGCGGVPAFGDEVDISRTAAEVQLRGGLLYQTLR
jgi:hypothetical protein